MGSRRASWRHTGRRDDPSTRAPVPDPFEVLGLAPDATADDVIEARRRLAKSAHPDAGGTVNAMQEVNRAADAALRRLAATDPAPVPAPTGSSRPKRPGGQGRLRVDHPSFTVEALPAATFEGLVIVASWLGELVDDEPPYRLEVALREPLHGWCHLDVVPDAGASTVSLAVVGEPGFPVPDVEDVRDLWVAGLNELDWNGPDPNPPLPS